MDLLIVWRMLRRWWWLIALPVVIVGALTLPSLVSNEQPAAGGYYTRFTYTSAQESSNLPDRDGDYQDVWLASEFVVNAFTDWVRSSSFRDELTQALADEALNLGLLGIASDNNRSIGVIEMSYPDPNLERIATAAITVLQTRNQEYFPHLGGAAADVVILDAPVVVATAPPLTNRLEPVIRTAIALIIGLGLAVVAEYLDPTLRYADEVEAQGLKVLARVPKH